MNQNRRTFFKSIGVGGAALSAGITGCAPQNDAVDYTELDRVMKLPVLKKQFFKEPVIIKSIELLKYKDNYIVQVRSTNGAEGLAVSNNAHMQFLYPLLLHRLRPFFINKDARELDTLIDEVYIANSNYKLQGLALWISLATIEFGILDMLGKIAKMSVTDLIGNRVEEKISVYRANNYRGVSAAESIKVIKENVAESNTKALKIKIGGRMSNNKDYPPGRTEELIPLVRKTFGDDMILFADSNGSYTVDKAIEIGKLLEEYNYSFYEEPCPFDWLEETKQVADALAIPISGGEQEPSIHRFRWMIGNNAVQIVQPDLFYFGGFIRATRVARMADVTGKDCIPHISNSGLGFIYMLHFVSTLPNSGSFHEFKGFNKNIPFSCSSSSLKSIEGQIQVPNGPGWGIQIDPDYLKKHKVLR